MKNTICLFFFLFTSFSLIGQESISGYTYDKETNEILSGTHIRIDNSSAFTTSNEDGFFTLDIDKRASYELIISYVGFQTEHLVLNQIPATELKILLSSNNIITEEILVSAVRATHETGATFLNIGKDLLEEHSFGQDIPALIKHTPSIVSSSDAGGGVGYTSFRIRGSDPTRVNMTINGIPYNDSESQGLFFVDLPDFSSSIENIQIQRGIGTSTNGAGAFGASININTDNQSTNAYAKTSHSYGSFNTRKHNLQIGTGLINGTLSLDARASLVKSDGYIDRASSDLYSLFISSGYSKKNHLLKAIAFTGKELSLIHI